ncbi:hypothetical protein I551_2185 [Mycobacterium ulcerans str. Harvey]|uniref:Uncharacterized protein n=1 Tax=Mycobacterium ulcerans str. Harvey TaxID=1299332 RepID=A0ABN0R2Q8_MYCUL|nr:hypothetical protein I551_2185 [Mycobacterium ulcerans str. Harvey]
MPGDLSAAVCVYDIYRLVPGSARKDGPGRSCGSVRRPAV